MTAESGYVVQPLRAWLRLEGLLVLVVAVLLYRHAGHSWTLFAVLFLAPDIGFLGYAAGPRVGAAVYNALHSLVGPLALAAGSVMVTGPAAASTAIALVWAAHIGFDRLLGYGLKYPSAFGDTHLGRIGRRPQLTGREVTTSPETNV